MIDNGLLYKVASSYYIKKRNQQEIASELGVSRVQVSKYLKMAEERGLVRIEVTLPAISSNEQRVLKAEFVKRFHVKELLVCPAYSTPEANLHSLVRRAEEYLLSSFGANAMTVGLGWGQTVYQFAEKLEEHDRHDWRIVGLAGGSNRVSEKYFNMNYLVQAFAEKLQARFELLYLPFFTATGRNGRDNILNDEYERISKLWNNLDIVVTSVGSSVVTSPLFQSGIIGAKHLNKLKKMVSAGDMLAHFYDISGNILEIGIEDRIINVSLEQLRRVKTKIIIATGANKQKAIIGALNARLIDVLVTDYDTANYVLNYES